MAASAFPADSAVRPSLSGWLGAGRQDGGDAESASGDGEMPRRWHEGRRMRSRDGQSGPAGRRVLSTTSLEVAAGNGQRWPQVRRPRTASSAPRERLGPGMSGARAVPLPSAGGKFAGSGCGFENLSEFCVQTTQSEGSMQLGGNVALTGVIKSLAVLKMCHLRARNNFS